MPLKAKLTSKTSDGLWRAVGEFWNDAGQKGNAEVLLKETSDNTLQLVLDSRVLESTIMDRPVLKYVNANPITVKGKIKEGLEVKFEIFWFALKRKN